VTQKHSEHFNGLSLAELSVIATEHQLQHAPHGGYIAKHDQAVRATVGSSACLPVVLSDRRKAHVPPNPNPTRGW
jgi:hypothetical protein